MSEQPGSLSIPDQGMVSPKVWEQHALLNLLVETQAENIEQFVHALLDHVVLGHAMPSPMHLLSQEYSVGQVFQLIDCLVDTMRLCLNTIPAASSDADFLGLAVAFYSGPGILSNDSLKLLARSICSRRQEYVPTSAALVTPATVTGSLQLRDFDWEHRAVVFPAVDKIHHASLVRLSLNLVSPNSAEQGALLELGPQELDTLIASLEAADKICAENSA
ncbi:hypothetical protein H696_03459 [Fonticula alba]|uniref:COMM domain-containing protein n=1 Tax=Fonticula alba TaxID=691883 RepID=A0A058Z6U8_FONAL|nr:hypothetical protein H696_03459 [Fonticula alba]KCV69994.1 hypothetical protein H696_03459 [Fonticula alba]|eukprot:XP_009495600.1 hypothetical protein H696_03459 [Fonticula alba]